MILLRGIQFAQVQQRWYLSLQMEFSPKICYYSWGQYMCGAHERLPKFGARTFQVISQNYGSGMRWILCKLQKIVNKPWAIANYLIDDSFKSNTGTILAQHKS
jgi:hypothetical protein